MGGMGYRNSMPILGIAWLDLLLCRCEDQNILVWRLVFTYEQVSKQASKHIERKKEAERQSSLSSTTTEAAYVAQIRFNDFCFLVSPSPSPAYGVNLASERRGEN
ncbi:hypothetical protein L1987_22756 [Smallanthus sonchifolius]|uniref:Uncharacterized protein n=1 Tax=Smallanthus sonchifolius TaxID=185202 RepID=A0ACB9IGB7_9ASTR|nr:hypothetical protein L1987_22756 [Smallanthus sonchifolius]